MPVPTSLRLMMLGLTLSSAASCHRALRDDDGTEGNAGGTAGGESSSTSHTADDTTSGTTAPASSGTTHADTSSTSTSTSSSDASSSGSSDGSACLCCGDGIVDPSEECDCGDGDCTPASFGFATCETVTDPAQPGVVFTGGTLGCNAASCRFDLSGCEWGCGDGIVSANETCDPGVPSPSCADLGRGSSTDPLPCDPDSCNLDTVACESR